MKQLQIPDIDLNQELSKCKSMEDLVEKNGLIQRFFGNIIQQFLEAEMEEHLGREKYETVCNELDKKVIGLYFVGVSVDDIQAEIHDLYGGDISPAMISKITGITYLLTSLSRQKFEREYILPMLWRALIDCYGNLQRLKPHSLRMIR
jgi:putative transposase